MPKWLSLPRYPLQGQLLLHLPKTRRTLFFFVFFLSFFGDAESFTFVGLLRRRPSCCVGSAVIGESPCSALTVLVNGRFTKVGETGVS